MAEPPSDVIVGVQAVRPAVLDWARAASHPLRVAGHDDGWTLLDCPVRHEVLADGTRWTEVVAQASRALGVAAVGVRLGEVSGRESPQVLLVVASGGEAALRLKVGAPSTWTGDAELVATLLGRPGRGARASAALERAVADLAGEEQQEEQWRCWTDLAATLGLPPAAFGVDAPTLRALVVAPAAEAYLVPVVAHAARRTLWSVPAGDRVLVAAVPPAALLFPVAAGLAVGRRAVVLLWRDRDACGLVVLRRGDIVAEHSWPWPGDVVGSDAVRPEHARWWPEADDDGAPGADHEEPVALLRALRLPTDDVSLLRALLRRQGGTADRVLPELVERLSLPAVAAPLLLADTDHDWLPQLPGAEAVAPAGLGAAVRQAWADSGQQGSWVQRLAARRPWWYRLIAVVAGVLLASVAWTAAGRATDPVDGSPWWWLWAALAGVGAVWALVDAVLPARRASARMGQPATPGGR